ncbi:peptidase family M28 family [Cordyceps militaris CM01]|uniref:Peptide hydrolase n=1 Tax=Cordyceps militaris (strain CM01) TaxID=983644 RepID=G3JSW9_CORMM|nr:peptidase family M28 family [Cordyceps militaris CM01]EGX88965.1 peptidase family M28 family [Cordyceps militaris CM01]
MSWRSQGITGSNNIPLGSRRRFGDDGDGDGDATPDRDLKRGRDPEPQSAAPSGPRQRKKRNRWGDASENKAAGLINLPTAITAAMTSEQLEAYTLHLRIEEISQKLRIDDVVPADGDRSPSPAPQYDNHGRRVNTREYRYRKKLEDERHKLIEKAMKTIPNYHPPQDYRRPTKTQEKVYVPVNDYPEINFTHQVGLLIGPRGNTLKKMETESGAKIAIRGKGSVKEGKGRSDAAHSSNQEEDLHCLVMADTEDKINKAKQLIHNVIETAASTPENQNELKRNQLRELAALNGTLRDDENQACQNCGKIGHRKYDCPEKQNFTASIICRVCGNAGHMARDCPDRQRGASWRNDGARPATGRVGAGDGIDREYEQLMQELGGGSGPPARLEAGPGGGEEGGDARPWQRAAPSGGPAPWRSRRDDREPGNGPPSGPSGGPAPWARDRGRGQDNQGDGWYDGGRGGAGGAPPWQQQQQQPAYGQQDTGYGGYAGYAGYGGYGAAPGMGAPPGMPDNGSGLDAPPGLAGLSSLIQQYSGGAAPPPPPPGEGPPPPPGPPTDQPPPPPPPAPRKPLPTPAPDPTVSSDPSPLPCNVMVSFNPVAFRPWPVFFWTTVTYLAIFIPLLYVHETVPAVPKEKALPAGVNLADAWIDLQRITGLYHPYNSHANDDVREYIIRRAKQILDQNKIPYTLEKSGGRVWSADSRTIDDARATADRTPGVTLFDDNISNATFITESTVKGRSAGTHTGQYFEGTNFYAYIHGKEDPEGEWWNSEDAAETFRGKGGVLVNCHYDSVATAYGATDDGMACITLLQLLSHYSTEGNQPKHGIVLLFNNGEEDGLLGAIAFGYSPLRQFCHTFVNLEGAGAGGRAMLFRTTDLEVAKAYGSSPHPFGSVIAADAFEAGVIRSGTDYQIFADHYGQRGMDIAFYEPRSRYHTEDDDARHASPSSIWHMLSAALSSTKSLSDTTGTLFHGDRADGRSDLVQNGRPTRGVWFDFFGSAWATLALRGLFAWTLTLLISTPLILFIVTVLLIKQDKYYFFASSTEANSGVSDGLLSLNGWRGLFRFPFALIVACTLTFGSIRLVGKVNPLIIYSSSYAVWAMSISIFYSSFWLIMRGSSYVRPSALHRGYSLMWLFVITWAFQIFVAVCEDRLHVGAFYFAAFFHTGVFLAVLISLLELFALPSKSAFARQVQEADPPTNHVGGSDAEDEEDNDAEEEATETTPLINNEEGNVEADAADQTTFATTYRRRTEPPGDVNVSKPTPALTPYANEQSWSSRLPSWTWFIQLLVLAPIHLIIIGNTALVQTSAMAQTSVDGSDKLLPLLAVGSLTVLLFLPLTPFIHRVNHPLPTFLFLAFIGTLIYNLSAFPFSSNYRFKYFFQQIIDVDLNTNEVSVYGIPEYTRGIIEALPGSAGKSIDCKSTESRVGVCVYDGSAQAPDVAPGFEMRDLVTIKASTSSDGKSINLQLDAIDTRTCTISFSSPVTSFAVENAAPIEKRPSGGVTDVRLWRRRWEGPWNVTLQLGGSRGFSSDANDAEETLTSEELKPRDDPFEITASCSWSDVNVASTIPAFTEFKRYAPRWAVLSKYSVGLVDVKKSVKV